MTRPLQHLEGLPCLAIGTATEWSPRPEGGWRLLLRKVEVRRDLEAQRRIGPSGACRGHQPQGLLLPLRTARNGTGRGARQSQRAGFG